MKIFFPRQHYSSAHRRHLFALLKPFIKGEGYTDRERVAQYGVSERHYTFVNDIKEADIVILTMSWLYYKMTNQLDRAMTFIKAANNHNKSVLVSLPGDFGLSIPTGLNVHVLREQGYQSKLSKAHHCIPVFIKDPLKKYYGRNSVFSRSYEAKPVIGFCGQANESGTSRAKELVKILSRNLLYYTGMRYKTPHKVVATKYLRSQLLARLHKSPKITDHFVIRKKHRAGVEHLKSRSRHETTLEFFDNIRHSDYVLCVRGVGNFSVRLYETLAMGRIPVLVDTDCILPHSAYLDWKQHVVWVSYKDRNRIADIVFDFHKTLNDVQLHAMFVNNRRLWENKLRLNTFFNTLFKHIM